MKKASAAMAPLLDRKSLACGKILRIFRAS